MHPKDRQLDPNFKNANESLIDNYSGSVKDMMNKSTENYAEAVTKHAVENNLSLGDLDRMYQENGTETPISGGARKRAENGEPGQYHVN